MTPPEALVRLTHLREAAEKVLRFSDGKSCEILDHDEVLRLALTKRVDDLEVWTRSARA